MLLGKAFDRMGPDEVLESALAHMQDSHPIVTLVTVGFPNCFFPDMVVSAVHSNVDRFDPSKKYEQIVVES